MTFHIFDTHLIISHDERIVKEPFGLDRKRFCFIKAKTSLQAEDATREKTKLMEQFTQENIAEILRDKFSQYQQIKFMDFQVYLLLLGA